MNIFKSHIRHNIHRARFCAHPTLLKCAKETDTALSSVDIKTNTCENI